MSQGLTICIQAICVCWNKGQRGGQDAVRRNEVAESLKLPPFEESPQSPSYIKHEAIFSAKNSFAGPIKSTTEVTAYEPVKLGGVSLAFAGDVLHVYYRWDRSQGAPERFSGHREAFSVSVGEWGRVRYNGRLSGESYWWYEKWVYNIGLFRSTSPNVFRKTDAKHIYSQMGYQF